MKSVENITYLKSEYKKINNLFLNGKFDLVIEKSKKIIKKNPNQIPFYNLAALSYREKNNVLLAEQILLKANKILPGQIIDLRMKDKVILTNGKK